MEKGKRLWNHQSHPDYRHPLQVNFLRLAENHTEPSSQQTESPTKLYLDSYCFYSPQVMEKELAHIIFSRVCTPCFSISAKDDTGDWLLDSHSAPRHIIHIGSDFLSHCGNITIRHFLTLLFSWGHLSADASIADIKMGESLPKESVCQEFSGGLV